MKTTSYLEEVKRKLAPLGTVTARPMMGGYLVYINGVYVAIVDYDVLYVKKFAENAGVFSGCAEASPYDGAKAMYTPSTDDEEFLQNAFSATFVGAAKNKK